MANYCTLINAVVPFRAETIDLFLYGNCISNFFFIAMNLSSNDMSQTEPLAKTIAKLRLANFPCESITRNKLNI